MWYTPFVSFFAWLGTLSAPVLMTIIFLIINFAIGMERKKAVRSAFLFGIGLFGLLAFIDVFIGALAPASIAMVKYTGIHLKSIDYGVGIIGIIFSNPWVPVTIGLGILLNLILLALKATKTLNIDIFNMMMDMGAILVLVWAVTGSLLWAWIGAAIGMIILFKLADLTAPTIQRGLNMPGICFPHGMSTPWCILAYPLNKLFDKIPRFKNWDVNSKSIKKSVGLFGDPIFIGFILGIVLGILARYPLNDILILGVTMAAVMYFIPITIRVLMDGLTPTCYKIRDWLTKTHPGRELNIGMDSALAVGQPETLVVAMLLVPSVILLAMVLPWNTVMPFGTLAVLMYTVCLAMPFFRMNILRCFIGGLIFMIINLTLASWLAPIWTQLAIAGGTEIPMGAAQISLGGRTPIWAAVVAFCEALAHIFGV